MRLIIVRHGETEENAKGLLQGAEGGLTQLGRRQAERLARRLATERIDMVYASDLQRSQETLAFYERLRPEVPVISTEKLREQDVGALAHRANGSLREAAGSAGVPFGDFRPPGGESLLEAGARAVALVERLREKHPYGSVCLFTHGGTGTMLTLHYLKIPVTLEHYREYHPGNASFHVLEIDENGTARLVAKNQSA